MRKLYEGFMFGMGLWAALGLLWVLAQASVWLGFLYAF
jgi:hypothetical protein